MWASSTSCSEKFVEELAQVIQALFKDSCSSVFWVTSLLFCSTFFEKALHARSPPVQNISFIRGRPICKLRFWGRHSPQVGPRSKSKILETIGVLCIRSGDQNGEKHDPLEQHFSCRAHQDNVKVNESMGKWQARHKNQTVQGLYDEMRSRILNILRVCLATDNGTGWQAATSTSISKKKKASVDRGHTTRHESSKDNSSILLQSEDGVDL